MSFDKTNAEYKDKNAIRNAWAKVEEELYIEDGKIYLAFCYISADLCLFLALSFSL